MNRTLFCASLLLVTGLVSADDTPPAEPGAAVVEPSVRDDRPAAENKAEAEEAKPAEEAEATDATSRPQVPTKEGDKVISGMSILGNQEAPKSLVIVPWKGSQLGDSLGISPLLDDSRQPVDREVFLRELSYYEIRSETKP